MCGETLMDFQSILLAMWPQLHYEIRGIGHSMRQGCREEKEWHKEIRGIERKSTSSTLRSASTAPTKVKHGLHVVSACLPEPILPTCTLLP